jgi:rubrerythrin
MMKKTIRHYRYCEKPTPRDVIHQDSQMQWWPGAGLGRICGYFHYGDEAPEECPYRFFSLSAFKQTE